MSDDTEPVSAPLRRLGASLMTLGRIRLELFAIEAQEEKERIASLLLWAVLAALLAGFGLLMLILLVTVIDQPASLFQASIGELKADADALRRSPGP